MRRLLLLPALVGVLAATALPSTAAGPTAPLVRPGLTYSSPTAGCSFAFLFRGSDGRDYAATAGHCALDEDGRQTWRGDTGPVVTTDGDGRAVGRFAYAHLEEGGVDGSVDLGLIRLDAGLTGEPQMCAWGGPTRLLTEAVDGRTELRHHGGGLLLGDTVPTRRAVSDSLPKVPRLHALGAVSPGDSGSGTTTADGAAVGINVTIEPYLDTGVTTNVVSLMGMQRLDLAVAEAEQALGVRLVLRTAPLLDEPLPTARC